MHVQALDHVNLIVADLEATVRYYVELFGLERRAAPPPLKPEHAQWLCDAAGRAIIHVNSLECPRFYEREVRPGSTGPLHHVALACAGHAALIAALEAHGRDYRTNLIPAANLRQVFTLDPNGVLLELNFFGE